MGKEQIGFIGLGSMGYPMAKNLVDAGYAVHGFDIRPEVIEKFVADGGSAAHSPAAAGTDVDILIIVVVNDAQVDSVLYGEEGAADALSNGSLVLVCSTVSPDHSRATEAALAERGIHFLDAPMSGGAVGAMDGTLAFMVGGPTEQYDRAHSLLNIMGGHLYHMGTAIGSGTTMKVVNQLLCGVHLAAMGEALALGARAGVDPNKIVDVISTSAASSWMFADRAPHILADDFTPHSTIDIWPKDLGLVLDVARPLKMPVHLASAAFQLFQSASGAGYGKLDDSAIVKIYEDLLGFSLLDVVKK